MHDHDPQPWQCDECGHVNSPDSPVCLCYFWGDETIRDPDNREERHREAPIPHCQYCYKELESGEKIFNVCSPCYEQGKRWTPATWRPRWTWSSEDKWKAYRRKQEEEPAPDLSHWLTVSIQDQEEEESRERWSNAQPCPQCGTPMLYQDELSRGLCPMCWSKNRKEQ